MKSLQPIVFGLSISVAVVLFIYVSGTVCGLMSTNSYFKPPAEAELQVATGYFLPQEYSDISRMGGSFKPFQFRELDGTVVDLNCEPLPPINGCLYDQDGRGDNLQYANKLSTIKYYEDGTRESFKILLSAEIDGKRIIDYNDQVRRIKRTVTYYRKMWGVTVRSQAPEKGELHLEVFLCAISAFIAFISRGNYIRLG